MGFWENVKQFNERWNDLPRRGAIVLMVLLALFVFAGLFSYIAPSVIAMVLAWVIHPVAKRLENVFCKIKLPAKLASLIAVIGMYGIVSFILFWIGARVVEEMRSLIAALPGWVSQASDLIQKWTAEGGFETFGVELFGWQVFDVPPEKFLPAPKVTSAVIRCVRRERPAVDVADESFFFKVMRGGFLLRRKTLANSLAAALPGVSKEAVQQAIAGVGLPAAVRGEQLTLEDFAALAAALARTQAERGPLL